MCSLELKGYVKIVLELKGFNEIEDVSEVYMKLSSQWMALKH